jgi:O-antigen/teichoic acid export membrane protein
MSRAVSISASLVSVPLTVRYLGTERYGLWMTISSVIAFLSFSDLGISNGLMNGIAKAHGRDDRLLARQYVSSALLILSAISIALGLAFTILYPSVHWASLFRVHSYQAVVETGPAVAAFSACFLLNIPASIVTRIQSGYQEGYQSNLWTSSGSVLSLLTLLIVIHYHGSLALLVLAIAGAPILTLLMNGVALLRRRPWLFPSWRFLRWESSKDLVRIGALFFALQIAGAVGFSSDNIVLTRILGPEAVTQYAVPFRLFSVGAMVTSFLIAPLWPAYGEALERRDLSWIRNTLYRSLILVGAISIGLGGVLALVGAKLIALWVGPQIHPSPLLLGSLAVWGVVSAVSSAVAMFLNGISVVRFQVILSLIGASINILISVYLTRRVGIPGVVLGSIVSQIAIGLIPYYLYVRRYFTLARFTDTDASTAVLSVP